jgi:hypothetical protein
MGYNPGQAAQGVQTDASQNRNSRVQANTTSADFPAVADEYGALAQLTVDPNNILGTGQQPQQQQPTLPTPQGPSQGSYTNSQNPQEYPFEEQRPSGRKNR